MTIWSSPWRPSVTGIRGVFVFLTRMEDLTIVDCDTRPFSTALGVTTAIDTGGGILLPALRRLTIYVACGDLDIPDLIRCAKARKKHSRALEEVTIVFREVGAAALGLIRSVEPLRQFVGEVNHRVGETPMLFAY